MSKSRCTHCNAPLAEGTTFCAYCDLGPGGVARPPPPAPSAVTEAASSGVTFLIGLVLFLFRQLVRLVVWLVPPWSRKTKIALGVVGLVFVGFVAVVLVLNATVYSIHMDAPRYSANPLPPRQRPIESFNVAQVVLDMRDTPDRTLDQRKQAWREKYEGRWVSWKGTVDTVYPNIGHLKLLTVDDPRIQLEVKFDPIHAPQLEKLQEGQEARVSGMLWGYDFTLNMPQLSEGALVGERAPGHVMDVP
ncbi:hypothetical protein [Hyalangium rubrum]|uniref:Zinc ribbon domain-containing protein n=1 Tax=Hyalangium rubrum TaxID=3103134 RepID=A0ABU5GYT0_9BACT|nr:hypothetical protein [Hyalangium sp. s54d21]MDY7225673.1 hypothetical protein [Hyalangium sp. s54d21]